MGLNITVTLAYGEGPASQSSWCSRDSYSALRAVSLSPRRVQIRTRTAVRNLAENESRALASGMSSPISQRWRNPAETKTAPAVNAVNAANSLPDIRSSKLR